MKMWRRRRVRKFVKYFVLLASQFSDQNRFCLFRCEPALTESVQMIHFPFFNSKNVLPQEFLSSLGFSPATGVRGSSAFPWVWTLA